MADTTPTGPVDGTPAGPVDGTLPGPVDGGPVEEPRHATPVAARRVVVGAAIVRDGALLAQQRAWPAADAGRWELPGGRVEDGEADEAALARECAEELGVTVAVGPAIGEAPLATGRHVLRIYAATLVDGEPRAVEHAALRWVAAAELDAVDWLPADRVLLPAVRALLTRAS